MAYYLPKTSDFLRQNIRTFYAKPPYFYLEKSEVFVFSAEKTQKSRGKRAEKPMVRILQYSGLMKEVVAFEGILGAITVPIYIYKTTRKLIKRHGNTRPKNCTLHADATVPPAL